MNIITPGLRQCTLPLLAAMSLLQPILASAQGDVYFEPSLSVFQGYDDNLFYTFDNEESDRITRVTPSLETGYESERLNWLARYSFDAETYDNNPVLDSWLVRRFADASIDYRIGQRLTLSALVNYTNTNTPMDLSLNTAGGIQGLLIGRAAAERLLLKPEAGYRFTEATTGSLAHTLTRDRLVDAIGSDINMTEIAFATAFSPVNTLDYGYIYRQYSFDNLSATGIQQPDLVDQESHIPWAGLTHAFSPRVDLIVRGGPRIYEDSVEPYALITLARTHEAGQMAITLENNETTLLGQLGRVDTRTISGLIVHNFGGKLDLQFVPAYAEVTQNDSEVEIFRFGLNARYLFNTFVSFTLSFDNNYQRVRFSGGDVITVDRNFAMLGITVMLPGRNRSRQSVASSR